MTIETIQARDSRIVRHADGSLHAEEYGPTRELTIITMNADEQIPPGSLPKPKPLTLDMDWLARENGGTKVKVA